MKRLIPFALSAAILTGCATSQMKSTPFYSGEAKVYTGAVEDRVNLWPFAYYREPAFSVLWPLLSVTDDHFALRPIYSQYRQGDKDAPYDEFNFLWPICQFDTKRDRHRILPIAWGHDRFYLFPLVAAEPNKFTLFPLVWWRKNDYFNIFPIWWYGHGRSALLPLYYNDSRVFASLLWASGKGKIGDFWCIPPLLSTYNRNGDKTNLRLLFGLGGYANDPNGKSSQWAFPFFYHDDNSLVTPLFGRNASAGASWILPLYYKDADTFLSLPYCRSTEADNSCWCVPPLLSGGGTKNGVTFGTYLLGLGGYENRPDGSSSQWALPLYYRDDDIFASMLFGMNCRTGGSWLFPLYYNDNDTFLSAFYWRNWRENERGERTLSQGSFPFWWSDEDGFKSLVYASWKEGGKDRWLIPPLLSDGWSNGTDYEQHYLLGLAGRASKGNSSSSWFFPLYYKNDNTFLSLPYSTWWDADGKWKGSFVLPLLTGFEADGSFGSLFWGRTKTENWLLPLWWKDEQKFVSPLWAWDWSGESDTYVIPPLLSWIKKTESGDTETRLLLGFAGADSGEYTDKSWFFPLYYLNQKKGEYISLPFSHVRDDFTCVTPFIGVKHSQHRSGGWLWPLFGWESDDRMEKAVSQMDADRLDAEIKVERHEPIRYNDVTNIWYTVTGGMSAHDESWLLSGLSTGDRYIYWNASSDRRKVTATDTADFGNMFAYKSESRRTVTFDAKTREKLLDEESGHSGILLNFLWHSKYETNAKTGHDYTMKSILWRFWHYEKLDGDVSVDSFPFFTYDAKKNGYSKTSLLWRLFRNEYDPKTAKRKVDLLFIPVWR